MEELIKALTILSGYIKSEYCTKYPTSCEHDVLYVNDVNLQEMDADTVKELIKCGFYPGSDNDYANLNWDNFTQEDWEIHRDKLTECFYSYRHGSC